MPSYWFYMKKNIKKRHIKSQTEHFHTNNEVRFFLLKNFFFGRPNTLFVNLVQYFDRIVLHSLWSIICLILGFSQQNLTFLNLNVVALREKVSKIQKMQFD